MSDLFGISGLGWIFAAAVIVCLALVVGVRLWRRNSGLGRQPVHAASRLAIIESTMVDAQRSLVLIACDDVEHLIMIGGPADLVIENDVSRVRTAGQVEAGAAAAAAGQAGPARADSFGPMPRLEPAPVLAELRPEPRRSEPKLADTRRQAKPAENQSRPAPSRPTLAAVPTATPVASVKKTAAPAPVSGAHASPEAASADAEARSLPSLHPPPSEDAGRTEPPAGSRTAAESNAVPVGDGPAVPPPSPPVEPQFGRRESATAPAIPPAPVAPSPAPLVSGAAQDSPSDTAAHARDAGPAAETQVRPNGSAAGGSALPAAAVPWPEADSIESEIVKALGAEPRVAAKGPGGVPPNREATAAAKTANPATTLGDLAERLEEALAREVQAAGHKAGRPDLGHLGIGEQPRSEAVEKSPPEPRVDMEQQPGIDRGAKPAGTPAVAPEVESRREARAHIERQEEAPVISLNSRRRETVDPLEDEMARLLGELTGDRGRR